MSLIHRYHPSRPLPDYKYIPGKNPHPHLHLEIRKDEEEDSFKYALDLFNYEYFWESHVYFEALWNANKRKGGLAEFCKAMIKLGAAGVKIAQNQEVVSRVHLNRAKELFQDLEKFEGPIFLNFELSKIINDIGAALNYKLAMFQIHTIK